MLQLDLSGTEKQRSMVGLRTDNMGIDSLVAVEIRSWFWKNLKVSIPVLKILNSASIGDLLDHALENLPRDLVPNLGASVKSGSGSTSSRPSAQQLSFSTIESSSSSGGDSSSGLSSKVGGSVLEEQGEIPPPSTPIFDEEAKLLHKPTLKRSEPMSFVQSMFWFVTIYLEDKATLNHAGRFKLSGNLRINDLERAVRIVGDRHEDGAGVP